MESNSPSAVTSCSAPDKYPAVLDVCCGPRSFWFDRHDSRALYCDLRSESLTVTDQSNGNIGGTRTITVAPDILADFRSLPFPDNSFRSVIFDPPHLIKAGKKSWLAARYGRLNSSWRDDLRQGFSECFRVLRPGGSLIFKWAEVQISIKEILALTPHKPLVGTQCGKRSQTHWVVFLKPE